MPSSVFAPDDRNLGGRVVITQTLTHRKNPKTAIKSSGYSRPPQTYDRSYYLSLNRQYRDGYKFPSHNVNVHHMNRRMSESHTSTERKKNKFDAEIYPSLQQRRERRMQAESATGIPVSEAAIPKSSRPMSATGRMRGKVRSSTPRTGMGHSPGAMVSSAHSRSSAGFATHRSPPAYPRGASTEPNPAALDPYVILEQLLKDTIVDHAIYIESDLNMLFESAKTQNANLEADKRDQSIENVKSWFLQGCPPTA